MTAFRVCIMGASLATGNMGVTALGTSLVKLFWEAEPNTETSLFIGEQSVQPGRTRTADKCHQLPALTPGENFVSTWRGFFLPLSFFGSPLCIVEGVAAARKSKAFSYQAG